MKTYWYIGSASYGTVTEAGSKMLRKQTFLMQCESICEAEALLTQLLEDMESQPIEIYTTCIVKREMTLIPQEVYDNRFHELTVRYLVLSDSGSLIWAKQIFLVSAQSADDAELITTQYLQRFCGFWSSATIEKVAESRIASVVIREIA